VDEPIKFYADEHYPFAVCQGLARRGIDVVTTQQAARTGAADVDQLAFATAQERVMVHIRYGLSGATPIGG